LFSTSDKGGEKKSKYALSDSDEDDEAFRKKVEQKLKEKEVDEDAILQQRRRERELIMAKYQAQQEAQQAVVASQQSQEQASAPNTASANVAEPSAAKPSQIVANKPTWSKPSSPIVRGTPKNLTPIIQGHGMDSGNRSPDILAADYDDRDVNADANHKSEKIKVDWAQVSDDSSDEDENDPSAKAAKKGKASFNPKVSKKRGPLTQTLPFLANAIKGSPDRDESHVEDEEDTEPLDIGIGKEKFKDKTVVETAPAPAYVDDMFAPMDTEDNMFAQFDVNKKLVAKVVRLYFLFFFFFFFFFFFYFERYG
jgi:hypothetical protein